MAKQLKFALLSVCIFSFFWSCQEPVNKPEPYPNSSLTLEKLDVNCTEAWLKVSLSRVDSPATQSIPIILTRDGEAIQSFSFTPPETLVVDAGLEPAHGYQYQAQRQSVHDNKIIANSNTLSVNTLDTTSHDFIWTIDTLGSYGSYFMDVAIIDENNIWAVGNIVVPDPDSSFNGTGWREYNAARWNGDEWELMGIYSSTLDLYAIWYIAEDDIWVLGSYPIHWNGEDWTQYHLTNMGIIPGGLSNGAIWGSASDDVYFVGGHGRIVRYDGSGFTRLESGTEVDLKDITGTVDGEHVFVSGWNQSGGNWSSPLLYIQGNLVDVIYESTYPWGNQTDWGNIEAIEMIGHHLFLATWGRDWIDYNFTTGSIDEHDKHSLPGFQDLQITTSAAGELNNIVAFSDTGEMLHFNGLTWHKDNWIRQQLNFQPRQVEIKGRVVVAAGRWYGYWRGIIAQGQQSG